MDINFILKIVSEAMDNNLSSWAAETVLGLECGIEGKEEALSEIKQKLTLLTP